MFDDLDTTLQELLADSEAPAALRGAVVAFATPDKDFKPAQPSLNFFLHDVGENRSLRDQSAWLRAGEKIFSSTPPVLRVDCSYLVTSWSNQTGGLKIAEEHRLLALALTWLARFPVIAESRLKGSLAQPPQPYPVSMFVAQTPEGQQMGHFWSALGIAPRPAFSMTVTVTLQPSLEVTTYPPAHSVQIQTASLTNPQLAGRILDATLAPIPGAVVTDAQAGVAVTSGPGGDFAFAGLPFGTHTLRVKATGHVDTEREVTYLPDRQIHNVILSPP